MGFKTFGFGGGREDVWEADDLFEVPPMYLPDRDHFMRAIQEVYSMRGKALHEGRAHPASAGLVAGPWIPVAALHELLRGEMTVPPVPWFERIVNSVLTAYARRKEDSSPDGI